MTRPGPKPGPPGSQRTARLVVRVTPADVEAYKAAAGRAGVSMGEWVRRRLAPEPAQWVPFDGTAHPLPPQCDYCGTTLPDDYPRHECPVCGTQACAECSCGRGTAHFDCETT